MKLIFAIFLSLASSTVVAQSAREDFDYLYRISVQCNAALDYRKHSDWCYKLVNDGPKIIARHKGTTEVLDMNKLLYILGTTNRYKELARQLK